MVVCTSALSHRTVTRFSSPYFTFAVISASKGKWPISCFTTSSPFMYWNKQWIIASSRIPHSRKQKKQKMLTNPKTSEVRSAADKQRNYSAQLSVYANSFSISLKSSNNNKTFKFNSNGSHFIHIEQSNVYANIVRNHDSLLHSTRALNARMQ